MENINLKISKNWYEKTIWKEGGLICGIDEAGRGPLAGPLVAAAAILKHKAKHPLLKDSKKLTQKQLLNVFDWLSMNSVYATSIIDHRTIDKHNIYQATLLAMRRATNQLLIKLSDQSNNILPSNTLPKIILIDAMPLKLSNHIPVIYAPFGETWSCSIAAASIIAKVTRDSIMNLLDPVFNKYKFSSHKGYATAVHYSALDQHGASIIHRETFLRKFFKKQEKNAQTNFFTK